MGEYAKYNGKQVKIGTCENMYYLRADQTHLVSPLPGNIDPRDPAEQKAIRFRFPFPDEDDVQVGSFADPFRGFSTPLRAPKDIRHYSVQFRASPGYLVSLPCPEQEEGPESDHGMTIHRNGFAGPSKIVQQAFRGGKMALVMACGGCDVKYSLSEEDAAPVVEWLRSSAGMANPARDSFNRLMADRIETGYQKEPA